MGERSSELAETTFELREVVTHSMRVALFEISTGMERLFLMISREVSNALWKPILRGRFTFGDDVGVNASIEE
jgi:hypothetical protein